MSTSELIKVEEKDAVTIVRIDNHAGMNILDAETLELLAKTLRDIENNKEARAVIITGEKNFSAGADIKRMKDMTPAQAETFAKLGHRLCAQIENMGKAVVAAIRGYALGGGCEIALACDIRIAAEGAKLGQPEINLGIIPGFGGTRRLPRLVGVAKAKELILTGKVIEGKEAQAIGLVNAVVKDDELMKRAEEIANLIAQKSPLVIRTVKKLVNQSHNLEKGLEMEIKSFSQYFGTEDQKEGMNAFLEKRKAKFRGV